MIIDSFMLPTLACCRLPWWIHHPCWCNQYSDHRRACQPYCVLRWVYAAKGKQWVYKEANKGGRPSLFATSWISVYVYTVIRWVDSHVLSPDLAVAVITGAVPPLNGGLTIVASATFLAGGSVWTYTTGPANAERLESPGPLNTSVHIQVKDTVHERTYLRMCILNWWIQASSKPKYVCMYVHGQKAWSSYMRM